MNRRYLIVAGALAFGAAVMAVVLVWYGLGVVNRPGIGPGPGTMMGGDPGRVMGSKLRDAPGPRISRPDAVTAGAQDPVDAVVDRVRGTILATGSEVHLIIVASPNMPEENFRSAGMTNPTIAVPTGTRVSIQVVNADDDMAHGLVVTGDSAAGMPMSNASPAFPGAGVLALGTPTAAGLHTQILTFTADRVGLYRYLCPIPGHAQRGMAGTFIVGSTVGSTG
ncbi:sulfocyanin-like copper-binding protein [Nocardia tengchongensis]|uniref:sulfocyanin-like copper-binding protein n=1 Tax=Nocardia tengchongensis TaxID=2055889 RepID=UPI00367A4976